MTKIKKLSVEGIEKVIKQHDRYTRTLLALRAAREHTEAPLFSEPKGLIDSDTVLHTDNEDEPYISEILDNAIDSLEIAIKLISDQVKASI